jgi:hypothetical protein
MSPATGKRPAWLLLALGIWAPAVIGLWLLPQTAVGQGVETGLWLLAVAGTIVGAGLSGVVPVAAMLGVGVLSTLIAGYLANWSGLDGRSYYAVHRPLFQGVASDLRSGRLTPSEATGSSHLPLHYRPISPTGIRVVGSIGDQAVVLLPQPAAQSDVAGYVYLDGDPPPDLELELSGRFVPLTDGLYLGHGWWWI